jgi:hypothetical protein
MSGQRYSEEDRIRGLAMLAYWSGNRVKAAAALKEADTPIPATTLRDWASRYPDEYERACRDMNERVWESVGRETQALAREAIDASRAFVEEAVKLRKAGNLKDASLAARTAKDLGVVTGISVDKGSAVQGRPTVITESRDLPSLIRSLAQFESVLPGLKDSPLMHAVESTAEETTTQKELPNGSDT